MSEPRRVVFKKRGPIHVEGPVIVRDEDGNEVPIPVQKTPGVVKFCGCGRSKTKPFCDGTHKTES
ncbi:MAG TPA: CDGSH iron-sulfur domain-containing protein [Gemmatimonadales bacterium]|nr:CDGSH iron-sulfur domain-containing protein [Gemmatimonadales bacterium]